MKLLLIFASFCVINFNHLFAQQKTLRNDFVILKEIRSLTEKDEQNLSTYNFDQYRYLNIRKKIQLINGPLIELLSLKELKTLGISINSDTEQLIKNKSEEFKHETILQLNIGLGIREAYQPK
jgi:S-adenosylmethionine:diacylglycerol 3-amino-3-carboxypropyl transferase